MEQENNLIAVEEALNDLLNEISIIELMACGLAHVKDPYADGFHAVYVHLRETANDIQTILNDCGPTQT